MCVYIYIYIYIYTLTHSVNYKGTPVVMVIIIGYRHGNQSSNPGKAVCISHNANTP